ncbi:hypothetical protein OOU_Y34scaffold01050g1 [Pyricularia oryzae Y34]|uniref:Uncharacterized protein n=2 Tax=Pyricularia oryzae TaxID=318829 RepID=A0AA97NM78_PYRO3|nr:hypothetical protein OOU_Y34scaffold01050g1 [Pyricularia oryzae Y34]
MRCDTVNIFEICIGGGGKRLFGTIMTGFTRLDFDDSLL